MMAFQYILTYIYLHTQLSTHWRDKHIALPSLLLIVTTVTNTDILIKQVHIQISYPLQQTICLIYWLKSGFTEYFTNSHKNILISLNTDITGPESGACKVSEYKSHMRAGVNHANTKIYCLIL